MFESRTAVLEAEHSLVEPDADVLPALESILPVIEVAASARPNPGYELPKRLWGAMVGCYAAFFVAILAATGGSGHARFAIVVSVLYTVMFFGLARLGAKQAGAEARSPLDRGRPLMTWTGPMEARSVFSQILIVPMVMVLFGTGIAVIAAFTG